MPKLASELNLTQVGRVVIPVADTDRALEFYVDTLGFEKVVDTAMGPDMRWALQTRSLPPADRAA